MTAPDELERAVERLTEMAAWTARGYSGAERSVMLATSVAAEHSADLRLLLSERAELLAAVERMRGALEPFAALAAEFSVCGDGQPISIKATSGKSDLNVGHLRRTADAAK